MPKTGKESVNADKGGSAKGKPKTMSNYIDALTVGLKEINKSFGSPIEGDVAKDNPITMENLSGKK